MQLHGVIRVKIVFDRFTGALSTALLGFSVVVINIIKHIVIRVGRGLTLLLGRRCLLGFGFLGLLLGFGFLGFLLGFGFLGFLLGTTGGRFFSGCLHWRFLHVVITL